MLTYNDFEGYVRTYTTRAGITDEVKILMIAMNLWQVVEGMLSEARTEAFTNGFKEGSLTEVRGVPRHMVSMVKVSWNIPPIAPRFSE